MTDLNLHLSTPFVLFVKQVAIDLSRKTFQRIKFNYVWAMGYNLLGIPIAAGAMYPVLHHSLPPWLAGLAMALSSISVVRKGLCTPRCADLVGSA